MKITKVGVKREFMFVGMCYSCGCEFEELERKLKVVDDQRDGKSSRVECPQCGNMSYMYPARAGYIGPG